jgi:nucleotide-binding universal stress UspA family protein
MKTIIAAIDGGLATTPVIATARALGTMLDADVIALHVRTDGDDTPRRLAVVHDVPLRVVEGTVIDSVVAAAEADDVVAVVFGARGIPTDPRPLGSTAQAVATAILKPVVILPPDARPRRAIGRVLVPLEGDAATSLAPQRLIELGCDTEIDLVVLHVLETGAIPAFTDQPQHEQPAWAREFLARYCPWGVSDVTLETRVGRAQELIPLVARERDCDLIALGWSQNLAGGRAAVVRATLAATSTPVLLVPVHSPERTKRTRAADATPALTR